MALQTSGQISLANVATEFEDTAPHRMSEFYDVADGIPGSGQISIGDFYGASSGPTQPTLNILTLSSAVLAPGETFTGTTYSYINGLSFGDNGSKMYIVNDNNRAVYQYTLTTAWDISSASYDNVSLDTSPGFVETDPKGVTFNPDGSRVYVAGEEAGVTTWSLGTPWDLSSATNIENRDIFGRNINEIQFNFDGTRMYLNDRRDGLKQYNVSNHYYPQLTISSPSFTKDNFQIRNRTIKFIGDNTFMIHSGQTTVHRYDFSTPNELSSAVKSTDTFYDSGLTSFTEGFALSDSGHKMYIGQGNTIYTYTNPS